MHKSAIFTLFVKIVVEEATQDACFSSSLFTHNYYFVPLFALVGVVLHFQETGAVAPRARGRLFPHGFFYSQLQESLLLLFKILLVWIFFE